MLSSPTLEEFTMGRRVVVTGLGAVTPLGTTLAETWQGICECRSGVGKITTFDTSEYPAQIAAEVKNFDPLLYVPYKEIKRYDRFSLLAVGAAQQAWEDASVAEGSYESPRMGCILGVGIGGLPVLEESHKDLLEGGPRKVSPFLIPAMISNLAPGHIGIRFGLRGVNYTITSACTSANHAIGESFRMIRDGLQDFIITGGAESAITTLGIAGFGRMKALSTRNDDPERASRPFDRDRDGFVMGEGAGILVLEEYESAKKRGAKIYGELVGYGFSCDAFHITGQPEGGDGAVQCMSEALKCAQMNPEEIQYINAHGTSTPINDPTETAAIKKVFGSHAKSGLMVSSTKSMTGHLLGGAGGIEAVFCAKALETNIVPPTANLDHPDPLCDLDYVPKEARNAKLNAIMSNSFGFGGTNASIVMKRL
jgi:3-oxoacyl-[acyl-carrier-protein] synthase II